MRRPRAARSTVPISPRSGLASPQRIAEAWAARTPAAAARRRTAGCSSWPPTTRPAAPSGVRGETMAMASRTDAAGPARDGAVPARASTACSARPTSSTTCC